MSHHDPSAIPVSAEPLPPRDAVGEGPPELDVGRRRARLSAYVYGNILVLAAVLAASDPGVADGDAIVVLLATTVTTYLAHVVAQAVGGAVGAHPDAPALTREELRDALPIISSGSVPTLILLLGPATSIPPGLVDILAAGFVIVRLTGIGAVIDRLSEEPHPRRTWAVGLLVAGICVVVATLKLVLLH